MEVSNDFNALNCSENNINEIETLFKMEDHISNFFNHDVLRTQQNSNIIISPMAENEDIDTPISKDSNNSLYIPTEKNKVLENNIYFVFPLINNINEEIGYDIKNINMNINTNNKKNTNKNENNKNSDNKASNSKGISYIENKGNKLFSLIFPIKKRKQKSEPKRKIKKRFEDKDNILVKIKRNFFNGHIIKLLNNNLIDIGSHKYVEKFDASFVRDVHKNKKNKELWSMTLAEFLLWINTLNKNYKFKDIVNNVLVQKNENFREKLNKKLCELYKDYIDSDDFKNNVIKKLELKYNSFYVNRFKYFAADLLNYFSIYE